MSYIMGLNLSDRIYLCGDTRLTRKHADGHVEFDDNFQKVDVLSKDIAMACAGDAKLAACLFRELAQSKITHHGIWAFRKGIEDFLLPILDRYFTGHKYVRCILLIGGLDRTKKKIINGARYISAVKEYQAISTERMSMKNVIYNAMSAKPGIINPEPELELPDSHLFAVAISEKGILITDSKWGEVMAFGDRLSERDLPVQTFGDLELRHGAGDIQQDAVVLTAYLRGVAEEHEIDTVGGSVVIFAVANPGIALFTGAINRIDIRTGEMTREFSSIGVTDDGRVLTRRLPDGTVRALVSIRNYDLGKDNDAFSC